MKIVQEVNRQAWADFVYRHPQGNIFQTPEMFEVYKNTENCEPMLLTAISKTNELLGILLSVTQRECRGVIGSLTTRSIIWGGPLIKEDDPKVFELILGEYDTIIKKKTIYSQFRNLWKMQKFEKIFTGANYNYEDHLNIIIDLNKPESVLWNELHSKRRNEIRRALREGTYIKELNDLSQIDRLYEILCEVYRSAKLPLVDKSMFISAFNILGQNGMIQYFGALNNNELIGVICILVYKQTLYDWYAGSLMKYLNKNPNDLLPWEVFKWGREKGYAIFDFGGAGKPDKQYGVRDYKKKFGGQLVNYGRFEKIHQPLKLKIAKAAFKLWQTIKR